MPKNTFQNIALARNLSMQIVHVYICISIQQHIHHNSRIPIAFFLPYHLKVFVLLFQIIINTHIYQLFICRIKGRSPLLHCQISLYSE